MPYEDCQTLVNSSNHSDLIILVLVVYTGKYAIIIEINIAFP